MIIATMSLEQFQMAYSTEEACIDYIFQSKWPDGFICPRCQHRQAYVTNTRRLPLYECSHCRHQTSLTAGTLMEGSRTELHKWLLALFLISRTDKSINAVELSKLIQVTYKTAWLILHKIRLTIQKADQKTPLSGSIRINSAVYGRPFNPSTHKHPKEHLLLVGSSLNERGESTYLKLKFITPNHPRERHIPRSELISFNNTHIQSPSKHIETVTGLYSPKRTRPLMTFASKASSWLNETFHGIGAAHLQTYLAEFCYRFNLSIKNTPIFSHLSHLCFSNPTLNCSQAVQTAA
ncbi:IS1595 family transposase [Paenibacillus sp. SYP-B3998]|uniref:IS1595 family transposase n=1 Tax=Paenibacillus sp. SYP-B3998 TaxID=2678564 RepID=A0A6G3ZSJ6_9BACL|nr:transposase [Paenibacillus sp. SYP-B3998]NEW05030.1 IS1595 family transposase [Paenibacillus sp. SYP-B3998]